MILIDDRLGSKELAQYFEKDEVEHKLTSLEFGDIAFTGKGPHGPVNVGIEVKKRAEFLQSMQSGRLAGHQLPGMADNYDKSYVFIEQDAVQVMTGRGIVKDRPLKRGAHRGYTEIKGGKFTDRQSLGFQFSINEFFNVPVYMFSTQLALCRSVWILYQWWQKPYTKHGTGGVIYNSAHAGMSGRVSPLVKMVATIPGVGPEKAKLIAQEFGSLQAMIESGKYRWMRIDGIGEKLAVDIMEFLRST